MVSVCSSWRMMLPMRHRWAWASLWKCTYPGSGGTTEHMQMTLVLICTSYSLTGSWERRWRWWGLVGKLVLALFTLLVINPKVVADKSTISRLNVTISRLKYFSRLNALIRSREGSSPSDELWTFEVGDDDKIFVVFGGSTTRSTSFMRQRHCLHADLILHCIARA